MRPNFSPHRYCGVPVVVVGASGFIGRWVACALSAVGADVQLVVRSARLAQPIFERYDIRGGVHEIDLTDLDGTRRLLRRLAPAVVFNLAGYGVDPEEKRDPNEHLAGVINEQLPPLIAETLLGVSPGGWRGRRVVHAGSVYEYGNIGGHLEESATPRPFEFYGRSKLAGTQRLTRACDAGGLSGLTARICQIYGPGEHQGRLLPFLLAAQHNREPLSVSIGTQQKDFTYVEDVAEGLLRLGLTNGPPGEVVNLATGRLTSVQEFVLAAARVLQIGEDRLKFEKPLPDNELQHREVAIARLRSLTGWSPPVDVAEGIQSTMLFLNRASDG